MLKSEQDIKHYNRQEAMIKLARIFDNTSTVYVVQKSVSKSGMTRRLRLYTCGLARSGEYEMLNITADVADLLGWSINELGIKVTGCGMDMHFHTVYTLSSILYGKNPDGSYNQEGCYRLKHESL